MRTDLCTEQATHITCPATRAAALVGDVWIMAIMSELLSEPQRYGTLFQKVSTRLPGKTLSSRTFTQRLEYLQRIGLIEKTDEMLKPTEQGRDLIPVLESLSAFGSLLEKEALAQTL